MTRYLSEVSGYYGCQWKQDSGIEQKNYNTMSELLQHRDSHCRNLRLNSFFENVSIKEHHIEDYSPSAVRKHRAKTVPPLQDIHEDTIFYPSRWVSPTISRKQRREILSQRLTQTSNNKTTRSFLRDENNNSDSSDGENFDTHKEQTCSKLRTTEKIVDKKFPSPKTKRRNFSKHLLTPLPEDIITRSFDETAEEEDSGEEDKMSLIKRRLKNGESRRKCRPRSWSE